MEFALTQEQRLIRQSAIDMVERDIAPVLAAHAADRSLPRDAMARIFPVFAAQGLTAPRLTAAQGGSGMKMLDYGLVYEQLPAWLAISVMAHEVTVARIYAEATPAQRRRILPQMIAGDLIGGTATSEPGAGSDPRGITTRITIEGDTAIVNGAKIWVSNGSIADILAVTCIDGTDEKGRNTLKRIVIMRDETNYTVREIPVTGLRQGHLSEIAFEDCRVPAQNVLSAGGDAARMLTVTWNGNRPLVGLAAARLAQRAYEAAVEYSGIRSQFGKPIAGHQLIQRKLADIETAVMTSRLLCYRALDMIDQGERVNAAAAMAKRHATTVCLEAISQAMGVHGGMGLTEEAGLEQLWRDCRMLAVPDATDEILTLIQGREITGIAAFG